MPFNEANLVNLIAAQERAIQGVAVSYDYARNPDLLTNLPAVVHYIPSFTSEPRGHYNLWKNELVFTSVLFVMSREAQGGKLNYIENAAIPFGQKWRDRFQTDTVVSALLSGEAAIKVFLTGGNYGAGGNLLQYNGIDYLGWTFNFSAVNA